MITSLSIKNYALIEDIQVNFGEGFTIITGETGSGKSILIEGLSLILGSRADLSSMRDISKKCIIEGTFFIGNYNLEHLFLEADIDYDDETIIRREILPSGKSRAFINDSPVNLSALSAIGQQLIDVHSQHQNLKLADTEFQFQVIDALGGSEQLLAQYQSTLLSFKTLQKELDRLQRLKSEAIKEQDYNAFLYNELSEAELKKGELENLEEEYKIISNYEAIKEGLNESSERLSNDELGILMNVSQIRNTLKNLTEMSPEFYSLFERINSAYIEFQDIYDEIERSKESIDADPDRAHLITRKLNTINNLMLKHSANSIDELIGIRDDLLKKVNAFEHIDDEILRKQNVFNLKETELNELAKGLHNNRKKAIPLLKDHLIDILSGLGMENSIFEFELKPISEYTQVGKDELSILFSANKGSIPKPMKQVASGGEVSRIMLAIKSILANYMHLPTIIFDEIDSGVSGEISDKMGDIMRHMSETMQVFTITHLPQIAAKGNTHYKVFKEDINHGTITQLNRLTKEERIVEIAQMLSGKEMTTSAIAHAKQLLN
ncbi:MAG: DNA repair protein RecN [Flavobacteriaceae bacterium]|nr:DNA repair protein RecN [Bacteroidia bacterium]MBT8289063.1 DNA repair protein RecN [Bacteroidia bacterium]NNF74778.1 DNA repair protein RecN [Flavobacteriaceae bacterium]NNK72734.1 DNA repair protein RecN [Flavobacteriaceae bacterium]